MCRHPTGTVHIEMPRILTTVKENNPYMWVPFRDAYGFYKVPSNIDGKDRLYLVTINGESYEWFLMGGEKPMCSISHMPFTHWFNKPMDIDRMVNNHSIPLVMDYDQDYLVNINGKLNFINVESLIKDNLPIRTWYDDKDFFSIRG